MADVQIEKTRHATLSTNTIDRITASQPCVAAFIWNRSAVQDIYVRLDGIDPVIQADGTYVVLANTVRVLIPPFLDAADIRLIASTNAAYSVECT